MHTVDSAAEGLVQTFFEMAENRGFFSLPKHDKKRADLEWKMITEIDRLIEDLIRKRILRVRNNQADEVQEFLLKLRKETLARPSECRVLKVLREHERPNYTQDAEVSNETLDGFTICYACMFTRQGYYDTHCIEMLNALRLIVAGGFRGIGHVVHDEAFVPKLSRSYWARYPEWACLARANGEHFTRIATSVSLAARSRIAS